MNQQQPTLFDLPAQAVSHYGTALPAMPYGDLPGHVARETSVEAAKALLPKLSRLQRLVVMTLLQHERLTDETIDRLNGRSGHSLRPRRAELIKPWKDEEGNEHPPLVKDSGDFALGSSGLLMTLWELTPEGLEAAEQLRREL